MSSAQTTRLTAILSMVAAMACLSTQDTFSKYLMLSLAPALIIWTRYGLQTALAGVSIWRSRSPQWLRTRQWRLQLLRGVLVVGGSVLGYGALLVVRPDGHVNPTGAALALMGVVCYTGFQTLTGVLARQDSPLTIQLYTSAFGFVCLSVLVPFFWPAGWPWPTLALLGLVALAGSYGQYFMVLAFSKAPASTLSPYLYSAIGFSALGGWVMFDHWPDALAVGGMGMIARFGLLSGWLNSPKATP